MSLYLALKACLFNTMTTSIKAAYEMLRTYVKEQDHYLNGTSALVPVDKSIAD